LVPPLCKEDNIDGVRLPNGDDPNEGEAVLLSLLLFVLDPNGDDDKVSFPNDDDPNGEGVLWEDDALPNGEDLFSSFAASFSLDVVDDGLFLPNEDDPNEDLSLTSFVLVLDIDGVRLPNGDDPNEDEVVLSLSSLLSFVLDPNADDEGSVSFPKEDDPNGELLVVVEVG